MVIVSLIRQYLLTVQRINSSNGIKLTPLWQVCPHLAISCCGNLAISEQFQSSFRAVSAIDWPIDILFVEICHDFWFFRSKFWIYRSNFDFCKVKKIQNFQVLRWNKCALLTSNVMKSYIRVNGTIKLKLNLKHQQFNLKTSNQTCLMMIVGRKKAVELSRVLCVLKTLLHANWQSA